jgi:hypothetical protein
MFVIPVTWETDIGSIVVSGGSGQKHETLSENN